MEKKQWRSVQYQYQNNIIKADRYIYAPTIPKAVIIGTSLSDRIVQDSIPGVYNMALPGMSLFDGYHILLRKEKLPGAVFIEVNFFFKDQNEGFVKSFDSPVSFFFKKNIPALRDENQPVGVIKHLLKGKEQKTAFPAVSANVFGELLHVQEKQYSNPDRALILRSLGKLKSDIKILRERGCKVFFFEMPVNSKLEQLPQAIIVRKAIKDNFPDINFLTMPNKDFETLDGVHLGTVEASEYTHYLKSYINRSVEGI